MYRNISTVGSVQQVGCITYLETVYFYLYFAGNAVTPVIVPGKHTLTWASKFSFCFCRFNICVVIFSLDQTLCCSHCVPHRRTHIRRNCRHLLVNAELFWSQVGRVTE